jgi:hypothetical protein
MSDYQDLCASYQKGEVCLFIGAGVSIGCGLPDWKGLAKSVVENIPRKAGGPRLGEIAAADARGEPAPPDPNALSYETGVQLGALDPMLSMRYLRLDPNCPVEDLVTSALYGGDITLSDTILEIASLENIRRICCFNYDDLLTRAFAKTGRPYNAVFENERILLESQHTLIFYPHGFLPDPKRHSDVRTSRIVISEDDYLDLYGSPYAWANVLQLILLLNYTALFIGCSFMDPNVRRLLDITSRMRPKHNHYAFLRGELYGPNAEWYQQNDSAAYRRVQKQILNSLAVMPIWVSDFRAISQQLRQMKNDRI